MDLSCCICIFVLSHFAFGSSNEDEANEESNINKLSHKESSVNSNSVAFDEPVSSGKAAAETRGSQSSSGELPRYNGGSGGDGTVQSRQNGSETSSELISDDISRDSGLNEIIVDRIDAATKIIEKESCIQFLPLDDKKKVYKYGKYFLHFTNPAKKRECVHTVTRGSAGEPTLVLGYDCMREPDIIHALMHLLGFRDEVTHPLRDSYIRVLWENIQPKYRHLFTITKLPPYREVGEYDMMSIMHFHNRAYSINGAPTTVPLIPGGWINPSNQLSLMDKMKLRLAFRHECNRRKVSNLLGTCMNSIQGDRTTGCSSGSETDRGASSGNTGASSGNSGASSGNSGASSDNTGASSGNIGASSGNNSASSGNSGASSGNTVGSNGKDKSGGSSGSDKSVKFIESGESKQKSLIGTDNDKIKALSETDKDKRGAVSRGDKNKIGGSKGFKKDKQSWTWSWHWSKEFLG
ncbi:unnamed protein product [Arctia plantaginis]|uniref:Metalloendopeptidase n=1 Tax=Arctia plantaginis TaxID=874455 RepID=A0A8S1AE83_ARCPL|nr:unnamed protein product [Arctia plantaginis]